MATSTATFRRPSRWLTATVARLSLVLAPLLGARPAAAAETADSSEKVRIEATRAIPLAKFNEETQRKILSVVEQPSVFRRMPAKTVDADPDLFLFLVRNPEVVVNIWQLMGVSNMTAKRTGDYTWTGDDGSGTVCNVELVYGTDTMHVLYGEGYYEGPLFKKKTYGRCVLVLTSQAAQGQDKRTYVGSRLDVFLTVDNVGVDLLARTLHPLVGSTADTNFEEAAKFVGRISQTAESNAPGLQRLAEKLTDCQPSVRERFAAVAGLVQQRAAIRSTTGEAPHTAARPTQPASAQQ